MSFFYSDNQQVLLGDRMFVAPNRMATVTEILIPGSKEALEWGQPAGGVILRFDDSATDCWLITDFDEDFELMSRSTEAT